LHPATGIAVRAAASLAATPLDQAREPLREQARSYLLAEPVPGRYAFHELLRAYAAGQCQALDSEDCRRAAQTRLLLGGRRPSAGQASFRWAAPLTRGRLTLRRLTLRRLTLRRLTRRTHRPMPERLDGTAALLLGLPA
jgi:hypothetical protein